jgi:hypothetical protein
MSDPEDRWPLPRYNSGDHFHLHALGVIALQFAQFEASVDALYLTRTSHKKWPGELVRLYYFELNEEKRVEAVKSFFQAHEKDSSVLSVVFNLLEYFRWCRNCRNQLLHAEQYPAGFGAKPGVLHLTKRVSKKSDKSGYLKMTVPELRDIADKTRAGIVQSAEINIYLRFRGQPKHKIPSEYLAFLEALPEKLVVPQSLELALRP